MLTPGIKPESAVVLLPIATALWLLALEPIAIATEASPSASAPFCPSISPPTATEFFPFAVAEAPLANDPFPAAFARTPKAEALSSVALEVVPTAVALRPVALEYEPTATAFLPDAVVLVEIATESWPVALAREP